MKKIITKLISVMLTLAVTLSIVTACDLVTTNTYRDMNQVVASVKVSDEVDREDILKRDLQSGYLSYGYQYVNAGYYTVSGAYSMVLDNLITNRIIIQHARIELAKSLGNVDAKSGDVENLKKYLSEYELEKVKYDLNKNINDLIKSYVEEDEEEKNEAEDSGVTARTAPTVEDNSDRSVEELKTATPTKEEKDIARVTIGDAVDTFNNVYDLNLAVYKDYKINLSTNENIKALGELLDFFSENGFVESDEEYNSFKNFNSYASDPDHIKQCSYFKAMEKQLVENAIVSKYEDVLEVEVKNSITNDGVWEEYVKEYKNQEALYKNDYEAYEKALDAASDSSFVVYNPYANYGYVLNLLIPFSTEQDAMLKEKKAEKGIPQSEIDTYRAELAKNIVAKDLRDSWVYLSNGEYNKTDKKFKFDEAYRTSDMPELDSFIGNVIARNEDGVTEKDDNGVEQTNWSFSDVIADSITMSDFFTKYMASTGITELYFNENDVANTVGTVTYSEDVFDKFNDLMYAFSSDPGCLGKEYGYLYSPYTSANTYVKEFAAASKAVVEKGEGAYTTVLTDYGFHIILCTKNVKTTYGVDAKDAFIADLALETDNLAKDYKQAKIDAILSSEVSKKANRWVNEKDDEKIVNRNKAAYKDWITEEDKEEEK